MAGSYTLSAKTFFSRGCPLCGVAQGQDEDLSAVRSSLFQFWCLAQAARRVAEGGMMEFCSQVYLRVGEVAGLR